MKKNNGFDYDGTALEKYPDECPCCGDDNSDGEDGWCRDCRGFLTPNEAAELGLDVAKLEELNRK